MASLASETQEQLAQSTEQFTQINRDNTRAIKLSSLFKFIEFLIKNEKDHHLIKGYNLQDPQIDNENRTAYLFTFNTPPLVKLFYAEGYRFKGRHLTVDECYSSNSTVKNGFSVAHYTEDYICLLDNSKITIHVYFNQHGHYYIQVKNNGIELPIDPFLENIIKNNSNDAYNLFRTLLNEKSKRYLDAVNKANEYEKKLTFYSQDFTVNKEKYIQLTEKFKEQIELANLYNDRKRDLRGKKTDEMVKDLLKKIEINEKQKAVLAQPMPEVQQDEEIVKIPSKKTIEEIPENKLFEKSQLLKKELDILITNPKDLENILKAHEIAEQLRDKLLELIFLKKSTKKQEQKMKKLITSIENTIAKLPNFKDLIMNAGLEGNVKYFERLFPHISEADHFSIGEEILKSLVLDPSEEHSQYKSKMAICNFLFENSESYSSLISLYTYKMKGSSTSGQSASFLFEVFLNKKFNLFEMLLKHGIDPNGPGLSWGNKFVSILRSIIACKDRNTQQYVALLLQFGTSIDAPRGLILPEFARIEAINASNIINKSSFFQNTEDSTGLKILEAPSDLWLACRYKNYGVIPYLLDKTDLFGIALSLFSVGHEKNYKMRTLCSAAIPGVYCYSTQQDTEKAKEEQIIASTLNEDITNQIKIMICPTPGVGVTQSFPFLQRLCEFFKIECKKYPQEIEKVIEKLKNQAERHASVLDTPDFYGACKLLFCEKGKLTTNEIEKLVDICCKIGEFYHNKLDHEVAKAFFHEAVFYAEKASPNEFLKGTLTYEAASEKIKTYEAIKRVSNIPGISAVGGASRNYLPLQTHKNTEAEKVMKLIMSERPSPFKDGEPTTDIRFYVPEKIIIKTFDKK